MSVPNETPTPFTDDLEDAYNRRACGTAVVFSRMREKERELAEAKEKLAETQRVLHKTDLELEVVKPFEQLFHDLDGRFGCNHTERGADEAQALIRHVDELFTERDELCAKLEKAESHLNIATAALHNIRGLSGFNPDESAIRTEIYDWADNTLNQIENL